MTADPDGTIRSLQAAVIVDPDPGSVTGAIRATSGMGIPELVALATALEPPSIRKFR
jgi:hypothetical protein